MLILLIVILVVACDQASKAIISSSLSIGQSIPVIAGFFNLTHVLNSGGAFGLFPDYQWLFVSVAIIVIASMLIYFYIFRPREIIVKIGLGLAAGGAIGNLIDRIINGKVTDFLDFHIWPVFNIADSAIFIGMTMIVLSYLVETRRHENMAGDN